MKTFIVGLNKVPYAQRACDVRLESFAKLAHNMGHEVYILNRYSSEPKDVNKVDFKIVELSPMKTNIVWGYIKSFINEFLYLKHQSKYDKEGYLQVYTGHYFDFIWYYFLSKITGYKFLYHYVEYRSEKTKSNLYHRINGWLCDHWGAKLWDGNIAISTFLATKTLEIKKNIPTIIIPPICDFSYFDEIQIKEKQNQVLFCGSAGYLEVITMIIDAYHQSKLVSIYSLKMVLSGSVEQIDKIKSYAGDVVIVSNLSYDSLIKTYKESKILVIPLRNTVEDIARFPNKICEYCAAGSLIITTKYGEPARYFENEESALIAEYYTSKAIAEKMNWVVENEDKMSYIAQKVYEVGKQAFSIESYTKQFELFLNDVDENVNRKKKRW